jgi:hypothetical protein
MVFSFVVLLQEDEKSFLIAVARVAQLLRSKLCLAAG